MIHEMRYVNSRGDEIAFGGDRGVWRFGDTDLFDISAKHEEVGGVIVGFDAGITNSTLSVFMRSGTVDERNRLIDVISYDRRVMSPGRLYAGESYLECYISGHALTDWQWFDGMLNADLEVTSDHPAWIRSVPQTLYTVDELEYGGHNYPYDYPHNYLYSAGTSMNITNPFMLPAACDIVFPGPCVNPYVIIAGNRYQVNVSADKGQLIIVKGFGKPGKKGIFLRSATGQDRKIFAAGVREPNAQIYAQIPVGTHIASWTGRMNIEVIMYEERSSPWQT